MGEELARKRRVRGGHKASATKMITKVEGLLTAAEPPEPLALNQLGMSLREKLEVIKSLDGEIQDLVEEEALAEEIDQADEYKQRIYSTLLKIEAAVKPTPTGREPTPLAPTTGPAATSSAHKVRLPKLTIRPFNGTVTAWTTFWDSYNSTIHKNRDLSDIEKFTYLRSLVTHSAAEAISGLTLTEANYNEAVEILSKRYGNKQQIVNKHMEQLLHIECVPSQHDVKGLRRLYDTIESNIRNLTSVGVRSDAYGALLSSVLMSKLPAELKLIVSREMGDDDEWKLDALMKVLEAEVRARERTSTMESKEGRKPPKEQSTGAALVAVNSSQLLCCFCQKSFSSRDCTTVVDVEARKRSLRKSGRCYICLRKNHIARNCRSSIKCLECEGRHHVAVCSARSREPLKKSTPNPPTSSLNPEAPTYVPENKTTPSLWTHSSKHVLLQTAVTEAFNPEDPSKTTRVRVVLDTGSQHTYVTDTVRRELGLTTGGERNLSIVTFGSSEAKRRVCKYMTIALQCKDGSSRQLTVFSVPMICQPLAPSSMSEHLHRFPHLTGLELADDLSSDSPHEVGLLIGSDHYWEFLTGRIHRGEEGPVAVETRLGWVLSGPILNPSPSTGLMTYSLRIDTMIPESQTLDDTLQSFWELESFGVPTTDKTAYDEFCEKITFRDGRYEVCLPWKNPRPILHNNFELCVKRLRGLLTRLRGDHEILKEYDAVIRAQIERGIVEPVNSTAEAHVSSVHYLPHHPVIRRDKETTKLRVVYDASAKCTGPSLNECLHAGPKFDQRIFDILVRFRAHRVAFTADIEKAFLMISLAPEDRDFVRFLWVDDPSNPDSELQLLRFTRVVFGVTSSPFLLNATVRYHMESHTATHKHLVERVVRGMYVDDVICGAPTNQEAYTLYSESKKLLKAAGFNLRKFASNAADLQLRVHQEEAASQSSNLSEPEDPLSAKCELKVLGVEWNTSIDQLSYTFEPVLKAAVDTEPTKRGVVSAVGKFYDPIGYLAPIVIKFKVFMQALCEAKIGWDERLPEPLSLRWQCLVSDLEGAKSISIPRPYLDKIPEEVVSYKLCGYCDASLTAYAAVVYLLLETESGAYVRFVACKTRVSPLKKQTIPRLELLSALLLARLMSIVSKILESEITIKERVYFTDSTVTLYWIQRSQKVWKPFVQNRVSEIRELTDLDRWRHCPGAENPADLPSRGIAPTELLSNSLWTNGPSIPPISVWTENTLQPEEPMPIGCETELRASEKSVTTGMLTRDVTDMSDIVKIDNFSSLNRVIAVTAQVLRFCSILKRRTSSGLCTSFDGREMEVAERLLIQSAQEHLRESKKFKQWQKQLRIFTDQDGVMRCQGRIGNAETVPYSAKYPILLPAEHYFTRLCVLDAHRKVLHCGVKATLTELRSRFWLVRGRSMVKKILHGCALCRKHEGPAYHIPPPPPLPTFRVQEAPPFSHTGVDFAGPLYVKVPESKQVKTWITLYTCCVTRAVHLDLVPDLTTSAFLRSFKRFSARRGFPVLMISDNGRTFKAAAREIQSVFSSPDVKQYFVQQGINWKFNVPRAPWWGGIFERLVRSVKRCLRKILGQAKLTYEELLTVLAEVELVLNSRPLTYVSAEDLEEPLTPSHLMYGRRILSLPDHLVNDEEDEFDAHEVVNSRLRYLNRTLNAFWKRWRREYLLELREAHRHCKSSGTSQIITGDVVVVHDENQPRSQWKLGLVEQVKSGADGQVRAVSVRVMTNGKSRLLSRPIQRLYPLEVRRCGDDETQEQIDPPEIDAEFEHQQDVSSQTPDTELADSRSSRPERSAAIRARDRILAQAIADSAD